MADPTSIAIAASGVLIAFATFITNRVERQAREAKETLAKAKEEGKKEAEKERLMSDVKTANDLLGGPKEMLRWMTENDAWRKATDGRLDTLEGTRPPTSNRRERGA